MKKIIAPLLFVSALFLSVSAEAEMKVENLLLSKLEGVDKTEVRISKVEMPAHSTLPKHWHPGEEFAYILSGSVTLWQEGKEDILFHAGDVVRIPLKQVHTAITADEPVSLLIFRVHEEGQPERVMVE